MMQVWRWGMAIGCTIGSATLGAAQSPSSQPEVPAAYMPPTGMCRVWLRDVPPMQQPAPTDCRSALRGKPVGATVLYGPAPQPKGIIPGAWTRPSLRAAREDERGTPFRSGGDDARSGGDECAGSRDPLCDDGLTTLPAMRSAVLWIEGQRPADLRRWFGGQSVSARFAMPARGGTPERVQWFDTDGRIVQAWTDRDGDGRADRVEIFGRDGARLRVVGQP